MQRSLYCDLLEICGDHMIKRKKQIDPGPWEHHTAKLDRGKDLCYNVHVPGEDKRPGTLTKLVAR